jgi:hypothetical protein
MLPHDEQVLSSFSRIGFDGPTRHLAAGENSGSVAGLLSEHGTGSASFAL